MKHKPTHLHCKLHTKLHIPYLHRCPLTLLAQYLMSMTEENCSYFKNMLKTHLLDENNILPSCEIEMP